MWTRGVPEWPTATHSLLLIHLIVSYVTKLELDGKESSGRDIRNDMGLSDTW